MTPEKVFHVLVFTEDGTKHTWQHAFATIRDLTKKLFTFLDDRCQTHRISFDEVGDDELRELLTGTNLRNPRHPQRYRLHQRVAAELLADGFIVHHIDADRPWGTEPRLSANEAAVHTRIIDRVRALLQANNVPADRVDALMRRYLCLVPYREIEAWLYQNTERAAPLCPGPPHCQREPTCRDRLDEWRRNRQLLDEHHDPPAALCLGKRHNSELVHAYPTGEVVAARKSLAAAVDAMLACDDLLHAIQRTHETPLTPPESL